MGIKLGDKGLRIKYLQTFLKENYSKSVRISGEYDKYTHKMLLEYLHSPDIASIKDVQKQIESIDNLLYYFVPYEKADCILYKAKSSSDEVPEFMRGIQDNIINIVSNNGWELTSFVPYLSDEYNNVYQFTISSNGKKNYFPKKELLKYINHNVDDYLSGVLIDYDVSDFSGIDPYGRHFQISSVDRCKVMSASDINRGSHYSTANSNLISNIRTLVIPCKPNTTYTIICNVVYPQEYYNNICATGLENNDYSWLKVSVNAKYKMEFPNLFTTIACSSNTKEDLMYSYVNNAVIWEYSVRPFDMSPVYKKLGTSSSGKYQYIYYVNKHIHNEITYTTSSDAKNILISYVCPSNDTIDAKTVEFIYNSVQSPDMEIRTNKPYKMEVTDKNIKSSVNYSMRTNGVNDFCVYEGDLLTEDVYMYMYNISSSHATTYINDMSFSIGSKSFYSSADNHTVSYKGDMDYISTFKKSNGYVNILDGLMSDRIINYIDGTVINEYSDYNDIQYVKNLLVKIYPNLESEIDGMYTENIKNAVLNLQQVKYCDASKDDRKAYVKRVLEDMYTGNILNLSVCEPLNQAYSYGKYNFDYITNAQIYNSMDSTKQYDNDNRQYVFGGLFSLSPTAMSKGADYFKTAEGQKIEGMYLNQSELEKIVDEVLENFPIDDNTIIKQNVAMPTGYVDAETLQLILNKIKEMGQ